MEEIQLDLIVDYRSNLERYPEFQEYFRTSQPPLLAVWGRHDPAFIPAGAEAYKRELPNADVRLLDIGHFALKNPRARDLPVYSHFPGPASVNTVKAFGRFSRATAGLAAKAAGIGL